MKAQSKTIGMAIGVVLIIATTMLPNLMMVAKTMFISSTASRTRV